MVTHDVEELIGMECTHNFEYDYDSNNHIWNNDNTVRCKIISVGVSIEEKFSYGAHFLLSIQPIEPINNKNIDDEILFDMGMGVLIDSLMFDPK